MPVYILYGNIWLRLKEVYTLHSSSRRKGKGRATPYGMVAEAVKDIDLKKFKYKGELLVPSSKVSRFAAKAHQAYQDAVILIKPHSDDYIAEVYAKSRKELTTLINGLKKLLDELRTRRIIEKEESESSENEREEEDL